MRVKEMNAKKIIAAVLGIAVIGAAGWFILLRPEEISEELLRNDFASQKENFEKVGTYLHDKQITTEITGFFSMTSDTASPMSTQRRTRTSPMVCPR